MSVFNTWVTLMGTTLDEANLMLLQLQQLNDSHVTLKNNDMEITNLQFLFILIKALPKSYSAVALTILATGTLKNLSLQMIQEQILNEEGWWSGPSASLNKVTLIKRKSDKPTYKCYYCQKAGHKANECQKKKKDAEEKDKKDKAVLAQTPSKAVNAHIVPTTATISKITDDNDIQVSIYAAMQSWWMVDSGATHHISPY